MKTAGIICEFNPFHEGHRLLIDSVKRAGADSIVCVMSGDYVQRGEPAFLDKFERACDAVRGGADLVLELPCVYALNSADYFARGGIRILKGLGVVDTLAFGSESGDVSALLDAAKALSREDSSFSERIKTYLAQGMNYPKAYSLAAEEVLGEDARLLQEPNNTLALCYLREIIAQDAQIDCFTIKRSFPYSASSLRKESGTDAELEDRLYSIIKQRLLCIDADELSRIAEVSEGLENRLKAEAVQSSCLDDLIKRVKTSRYTYAKISRILMQILLEIDKDLIGLAEDSEATYAKVLALNEKGAQLLKAAQEKGNITIYSNINKEIPKDAAEEKIIGLDIKSSDIYSVLCGRAINEFSDRVRIPVIMKF